MSAPYALIGRCGTCGNVVAIDLDGSDKHERELQAKSRTVTRHTEEEAIALFKCAKRCDHKTLIAELRAKLQEAKP